MLRQAPDHVALAEDAHEAPAGIADHHRADAPAGDDLGGLGHGGLRRHGDDAGALLAKHGGDSHDDLLMRGVGLEAISDPRAPASWKEVDDTEFIRR
jgi:hypothetical protein